MSTPLVAIDNLYVEYATDHHTVRPLNDFSMCASAGQLVALLGPSGSGKTTLLSVLSGLTKTASGKVVINGIDVGALSGRDFERYRRNTIGIIFQGFNLIPALNARENVAAPLLVSGTRRKQALQRADELLDDVGLSGRGRHMPIQLSGGEQQRVAIARSLVGDPVVLLADEPTANLDYQSADAIIELLTRLRERGRTVVIATHDYRLLPAMDVVVQMGSDSPSPQAAIDTTPRAPSQVAIPQLAAPYGLAFADHDGTQ